MILPWPAKHERDAAIAAARKEREHSEAAAGRAAVIERQIRQMAADNHFAEAVARQIFGRQP